MSIRLDPRRVNALKHLAGEAGVRPGDLVRQWVEERLDSERGATPADGGGESVSARLEALAARVAAIEAGTDAKAPEPTASAEPMATVEPNGSPAPASARPKARKARAVSAAPSGERVALHDEMIAVIRERGPLPAAELAAAVAERGRYAPPRSGKAIDAAMVSQRVSNPTYRSRFRRAEGRIGLAEEA